MKTILSTYLLSSVLLAAANAGSGGSETQADKARKAAEEEKKKREEEEAKKQKEAAERETKPSEGDKPELVGGQPEGGQEEAPLDLAARLDGMERMMRTLMAGMAGTQGQAPEAPKDTTTVGPGAGFDPKLSGGAGPGVTSSNPLQPRPMVAGATSSPREMGAEAMWNSEANPTEPRKAREYPTLADTDVRVRETGYYSDVIQNPGDIIRGYTGPAASWFYPLEIEKNGVASPVALAKWNSIFAHRAPVYAGDRTIG